MTKNSVSISMTKLRNDAFLAEAGYENMGDNLPKKVKKTNHLTGIEWEVEVKDNNIIKKGDIITNNQTGTKFEVIDQKRDNNGFAAMLVKNIDNNNANNIKYAIVYRGTDGINDISTNPTALLDMRRLLLTHTLELRLSLYRDFALHLCGLSFLCHR